jgi:hypothetical protein
MVIKDAVTSRPMALNPRMYRILICFIVLTGFMDAGSLSFFLMPPGENPNGPSTVNTRT